MPNPAAQRPADAPRANASRASSATHAGAKPRTTAARAAAKVTPDVARKRDRRESGRAKGEGDVRSESSRDCDRITYSWAWRRLDGVTQVLTPYSDYPTWHNRLTHSEKVAQVSRTIAATVLQRERSALIRKLGGIDVYVCEAAGLAHDLGHPPFGHIGEETLDQIAREEWHLDDGFEGNAQTMRIVTTGNVRSIEYLGLDLTSATLAAIAKYPWVRAKRHKNHDDQIDNDSDYRKKWSKFSFYNSQAYLLPRVREFATGIGAGTQTVEASIMDIADDITYAIHDLEDFYLSGLLDSSLVVEELRHLVSEKPPQSPSPIEKLESSLSQNNVEYYDHSMFLEAADYVRSKLTDEFPRLTSPKVEPTVRQATSDLIGRYILAVKLSEQPLWAGGPHLSVDRRQWHELQIFKAITMNYVISRSDIAVIQRGQAAALKTLAGLLDKWINDSKDRRRAPRRLQDLYALAQTEEERKRCVLDYLCSLTDLQCLSLLDALLGSRAPRVGLPFM